MDWKFVSVEIFQLCSPLFGRFNSFGVFEHLADRTRLLNAQASFFIFQMVDCLPSSVRIKLSLPLSKTKCVRFVVLSLLRLLFFFEFSINYGNHMEL